MAASAAASVVAAAGSARAQTAAAPEAQPTAVAADAPRSASLSWVRFDGAASCATATEIAEGVARILNRDALVPPTRAVMAIEARVERIPNKKRFRATIDISGGDGKVRGTRKLESQGDDCRKLDEPAALAIALMIDPDALQPRPPAPPAQPMLVVKRDILLVPIPVLVERPPPPPLPPRPLPPNAPELTLAIGPSLALGIVPGPAPGLRFGVEFGPPDALGEDDEVTVGPSSIRAGFAVYAGSQDIEDDGERKTASLSMIALLPQIAACPTTIWIGTRVAFAPCLAVDVGAIAWRGEGFDTEVASGTRAFVSVGPVAQGRVVLAGPLALELRGAAVVPLTRDNFVYGTPVDPSALAYEPGAVGAQLDAALAVGLAL